MARPVTIFTGQWADLTEDCGLKLGKANSIVVDPQTLATSVEGIFAAGDVTYGTKSVVQAIASGRDAAVQIDRYLGGDGQGLDLSHDMVRVLVIQDRAGNFD